jgi:prophage tail gpP-like protein
LTAVSTTRTSKENIELGGNILNGIIHHSNVNRFNSYVVKGYGKETDFNQPLDYLQPMGTATDSVIKNTKRKIVHLSDAEIDSGTASNQAKFIRNFSAGKSRPLRYRIRDWKQANGELWKINSLAQIKDTYAKISGKQMLISDLEFMYTEEEGYYTDITVVDKNTYTTSDELIKSGFDR